MEDFKNIDEIVSMPGIGVNVSSIPAIKITGETNYHEGTTVFGVIVFNQN